MSEKKTAAARKITVALPQARKPGSRPALRDVKAERTSSAETTFPHLSSTSMPGVFMNAQGNLVDKRGVLLSLGNLRSTEDQMAEAIIGGPVDSPAKLLKRVALDPQLPMLVRIDAAKAAAPYFDKKTPVSIEQSNNDLMLDMTAIAKMPTERRRELLAILKGLGVDLGPGAKK
jgi:hypothetical protein